jgi:hypothetical protein
MRGVYDAHNIANIDYATQTIYRQMITQELLDVECSFIITLIPTIELNDLTTLLMTPNKVNS